MRQLLFAAIGILTTLSAPGIAFAQGEMAVCRPGGACVRTSQANYNRCVDLALRSGQNLSRGDRHSFDKFVYDCVAGRVVR